MTDAPGPGWWQASDGNWYPPPAAPPPAAWGPPGPYIPPRSTNSNAVIALVLGILSLSSCGCLTGIPAIILARSAKREIEESNGRQQGEGLAKAGLITGIIGTTLTTLTVLWFILFFWVFASTSTTNDDTDFFTPTPAPTVSLPR